MDMEHHRKNLAWASVALTLLVTRVKFAKEVPASPDVDATQTVHLTKPVSTANVSTLALSSLLVVRTLNVNQLFIDQGVPVFKNTLATPTTTVHLFPKVHHPNVQVTLNVLLDEFANSTSASLVADSMKTAPTIKLASIDNVSIHVTSHLPVVLMPSVHLCPIDLDVLAATDTPAILTLSVQQLLHPFASTILTAALVQFVNLASVSMPAEVTTTVHLPLPV